MDLEACLYEYMQNGGRNPGLLKKFIIYLEDNSVDVKDYPMVVDDFITSFAFAGSTKRSYRTSCNNFVRYIYRRLGLFLPGGLPEQEDEVSSKSGVDCNPWSSTRKKLKNESEKYQKREVGICSEKFYAGIGVRHVNNDKEVRDEEEYNAFLEKYERLCK